MTGWRRTIELALSEEDVARLTAVARSRTEPASRVERARMLLWEYFELSTSLSLKFRQGASTACV
jgi:hypothetical protein